jgi:hypothetical protein
MVGISQGCCLVVSAVLKAPIVPIDEIVEQGGGSLISVAKR